MKCSTCGDDYPEEYIEDGVCRFCLGKKRFAAFAKECGLAVYPDPTGERYVYHLDGDCAGKKSECVHLIDDLWNALVRAKGESADLILGKD